MATPCQSEKRSEMKLTVSSFGYQRSGPPEDADLVLSTEMIGNPYHVPDLRYRTGLDQKVHDKVFYCGAADILVDTALDDAKTALNKGVKKYHVAVGCTAGKHRSVAIAQEIARRAEEIKGISDVRVSHKDLEHAFNSHSEVKRLKKALANMEKKLNSQRENIARMRNRIAELEHGEGPVAEVR